MIELLHQHPVIISIGAYWVFSSIVGGMPPPLPNSGRGYGWAYNSLHMLSGNIQIAMAKKFGETAVPLSPGDSAQLKNIQMTNEGFTADSATIQKAEEK